VEQIPESPPLSPDLSLSRDLAAAATELGGRFRIDGGGATNLAHQRPAPHSLPFSTSFLDADGGSHHHRFLRPGALARLRDSKIVAAPTAPPRWSSRPSRPRPAHPRPAVPRGGRHAALLFQRGRRQGRHTPVPAPEEARHGQGRSLPAPAAHVDRRRAFSAAVWVLALACCCFSIAVWACGD
jgi:hypothetical protein